MRQSFPATIESLEGIFAFAAKFFAQDGIAEDHQFAVQFALEEIFTNFVKYAPEGRGEVRIDLSRSEDRIQVRLAAFDVDRFDPTQAPEPAVDAAIEEREVGGLGIFLTRKVMDSMEYEYSDRTGTITLSKKLG